MRDHTEQLSEGLSELLQHEYRAMWASGTLSAIEAGMKKSNAVLPVRGGQIMWTDSVGNPWGTFALPLDILDVAAAIAARPGAKIQRITYRSEDELGFACWGDPGRLSC